MAGSHLHGTCHNSLSADMFPTFAPLGSDFGQVKVIGAR